MDTLTTLLAYTFLQSMIVSPHSTGLPMAESSPPQAVSYTTSVSPDAAGFCCHRTEPGEQAPNTRVVRVRAIPGESPRQSEKKVPGLVITDIQIRLGRGDTERVLIFSNISFTPLTFVLEGERPRFVIDIRNTASVTRALNNIPVNGNLIKQVRTHHHRKTGTFRVVLDLYPSGTYSVNHAFYEAEKLYAVEVAEGHKTLQKTETEREAPTHRRNDLGENRERTVSTWVPLRSKGKPVDQEDLRAMLLRHNFYSSCWNFNSDFCNPTGRFDNLFLDNGDGTISDQATGLMWQKGGTANPLDMRETFRYLADLNARQFAGHSDWRLPTIEELASLLESSWSNENLYLDTLFDPGLRTCWSSDTFGPDKGWKVNFYIGYIIDSFLSEKNSVRAVRSISGASPPRITPEDKKEPRPPRHRRGQER